MAATLTAIVFHILQYQLLYKDGLPLALLGQGFTYTSLGFLRTRSTWMGTKNYTALCIRILLVTAIPGIALVSLVSAPATAVLILPRIKVSLSILGEVISQVDLSNAFVVMCHRFFFYDCYQDQTIWTPGYWLNGASSTLWPVNLTMDYIGDLNLADQRAPDSCNLNRSTTNPRCISMAYQKSKECLTTRRTCFIRNGNLLLANIHSKE